MFAIIIGAGTGISQGVARLFGEKGFAIGLIARNEAKLKEETATLNRSGITAYYAVADTGNAAALYAALDQLEAKGGSPDLVHYNASASVYKPLEEEDWASIIQQLDVNAGGPFHVLKRYLPKFKEQNEGKLFFTGGGLSLYPQPGMAGLALGKAAMRNLVLGTAVGLKHSNVHVATVTVTGFVKKDDERYNPAAIAEIFWKLYQQQAPYETEIVY